MKTRVCAAALLIFFVELAVSGPLWRLEGWSAKVFRLGRIVPPSSGVDNSFMWVRSGSLEGNDNDEVPDHGDVNDVDETTPLPTGILPEVRHPCLSLLGTNTLPRHCSDLLLDLRRRATLNQEEDESLELRHLVAMRSLEYLEELAENRAENDDNVKIKLSHPRKLLHFLAPKIPAIKHSPDVNLRIHSARSDIDSGVAACVIGTLAHVSEIYDKERERLSQLCGEKKPATIATDLITDRRFEQLVECLLSGVNVKKRKREALQRMTDAAGDGEDIENLLDEESLEESDGLTARDACRAAWGMAILGAHHLGTMGGEEVLDLLQALSLRTRELLLARLKLLRQDDLLSEPGLAHLTIDERMNELAQELAEDTASAMWTFACVRACTGLYSVPLFETCCSILCQDPFDLRRRAQEVAADGNSTTSVGNNDIVDRLAKADTDEVDVNDQDSSESRAVDIVDTQDDEIPTRDTLLDWLSKTQMNDIMWALALHGRENTTLSNEDLMLSETASTLGEIAFDRLIEALEEDLKMAEKESLLQNEALIDDSKLAADACEIIQEQSVEVEVVDAAAILSAEAQGSTQMPADLVSKLPVESMILKAGGVGNVQVEQVQVVDAAALLAAENRNDVAMSAEVMVTSIQNPLDVCEESLEVTASQKATSKDIKVIDGETDSSVERMFSPHDLASIAWSAVELNDPLRMQVLPIVIKLVAMLGESGTEDLSGADLANLAWAVSRFEAETSEDVAHTPSSLSLSVISWICNTSLQRASPGKKNIWEVSENSLLDHFQPPELGRLLWAVACVMSTYAQVPDRVRMDENIHRLATVALKGASQNLSLFGTEELLRICWAFLELCGYGKDVSFDPSISLALGRILSTVEQSLYRWERGDCKTTSRLSDDRAPIGHEGSLFSSFFGKSRHNQPLLEQLVGDNEDDDDNELAPIIRKSRRPLLRDLSVDPSTLCKAACAFQRILVHHPEVKGGWKLTSVAIRLLTSKNARLMKECSIHDMVRLCEAAVRSDPEGQGRELVTGLFAHKVVQVFNEVLHEDGDSTSIKMKAASPAQISTLVWALADLGVKFATPDDESRPTAYRRLRLMTSNHLLTPEQIESLDTTSAMKLLRGLVLMKCFQSDPEFLLTVLKYLGSRADDLDTMESFCSVAETLALLKEALKSGDATDGQKSSNVVNSEGEGNAADIGPSPMEENNNGHSKESLEDEIVSLCDEMLKVIAEKAQNVVTQCSGQELRRIISVYSLLPFQADGLVQRIEDEVDARLPKPNSALPQIMVEEILLDAKEKGETVQKELFHESDDESTLAVLRNKFMSIFQSSEGTGLEETNLPEELATMIRESVASTVEASTALQEMQQTLNVSIDTIGQQNSEGAYFELGRCQELIANYRLVEFSTGTRRSRYDKERRIEMSKRVLSRLLP